LINLDTWRDKYTKFRKIDYANTFYGFWKWKIGVELDNSHILDMDHLGKTHSKLEYPLKLWQTYRPFDSTLCLERLKTSFTEIASAYNEIRKINLLNFHEVPIDQLNVLWDKLGRVKEPDGKERLQYYIVGVTKPLMFLWGQTLAFDSYVRENMPTGKVKFIEDTRWTFTMWYNVMKEFQQRILEQPDFIDLCNEISLRDLDTDELVPYGQYYDLYYWVR